MKDQLYGADYVKEEDPKLYISEKTGRGPLSENWISDYWSECQVIKILILNLIVILYFVICYV